MSTLPIAGFRILFWGMPGAFSQEALAALLAANAPVMGVLVPGPGKADREAPRRLSPPAPNLDSQDLLVLNPFAQTSIIHLAWQHDIPVYELGSLATPAVQALVAGLQPHVACVACFPRRIPGALLELPPLGFLNVHPSLLPDYRGPFPLFWAFRHGERHTGVTVHFMDAALDTGDIARQAPFDLPDGISGPDADRLCGALGGRLLVETVTDLAVGTLARDPQPPGGRYFGPPRHEDFCLDTCWSARRAFNFMRGTAEWGHLYEVVAGGARLRLSEAQAFSPDGTLSVPYARHGRRVQIAFSPGILDAALMTE